MRHRVVLFGIAYSPNTLPAWNTSSNTVVEQGICAGDAPGESGHPVSIELTLPRCSIFLDPLSLATRCKNVAENMLSSKTECFSRKNLNQMALTYRFYLENMLEMQHRRPPQVNPKNSTWPKMTTLPSRLIYFHHRFFRSKIKYIKLT